MQLKIRVLIVDDNATDRLVVKSILQKMRLLDIQEAENGNIAEGKMDNAKQIQTPFDLIIVDWKMPVRGGLKVLQNLQVTSKSKRPKIIIMTATAETQTVKDAIANGADDFILKPIEFETLKRKIEQLFS